jgi:hypothetical protein
MGSSALLIARAWTGATDLFAMLLEERGARLT